MKRIDELSPEEAFHYPMVVIPKSEYKEVEFKAKDVKYVIVHIFDQKIQDAMRELKQYYNGPLIGFKKHTGNDFCVKCETFETSTLRVVFSNEEERIRVFFEFFSIRDLLWDYYKQIVALELLPEIRLEIFHHFLKFW